MFLCTAEGKKVKIAFELPQENIKIGDFIKVYDDKSGVIAQIINVKTDENSSGNYAEGIILKTLLENNQWSEWQGNSPSRGFNCQKVYPAEFTENTAGNDLLNPVNIGYLISNNKPFDVAFDKINNPLVILGDTKSVKKKIIEKLAKELSSQNKKCVIFDLKGDFSSLNNESALIAGKNFKLPLNSDGIQSLYEKTLSAIPAKVKAVIEDVLMDVQDYADKSDLGFVPFSSFKDVVENEYKNSNVSELVLLKNQLSKLEKQCVYGNTKREINAFKNAIEKENIVTIDLSVLPELWHTEILNYVINTGIKENQEFVLFIEADDEFSDSKLIDKILSLKNKSKITPFISASYQNQNIYKLISSAENILFFAPKFSFDLVSFKEYLELLSVNNAVFYGIASSEIPVFINIETDIEYFEEIENFVPQKKQVAPPSEFSQFLSFEQPFCRPFEQYNEINPLAKIKEHTVLGQELSHEIKNEDPQQDISFSTNKLITFNNPETFEPVFKQAEKAEEEFDVFEEYSLSSEPVFEETYEQSEDVTEEPVFEETYEQSEEVTEEPVYQEVYEQSEEITEEPVFEEIYEQSEDVTEEPVFEETYEQSEEITEEPVFEEIYEQSEDVTEEINPYELDDSFEDIDFSEIEDEQEALTETSNDDEITSDVDTLYTGGKKTTTLEKEVTSLAEEQKQDEIPIYAVETEISEDETDFNEGENVNHDKYGSGTIKKIINYGNKKLLSIQFEGVGRRLLDPQLAIIRKS